MNEKSTADLLGKSDDYIRIQALREQRDMFKRMLEKKATDTLQNFWNYLVAMDMIREGYSGEQWIKEFIKEKLN